MYLEDQNSPSQNCFEGAAGEWNLRKHQVEILILRWTGS